MNCRGSMMKMSAALVVLALVLAVLGAGLSYSGYNESLKPVTTTSTRTFTVTSTTVVASTSTESVVMTTSSTSTILSTVFDLSAPGPGYCGVYAYFDVTLDAGQAHVSYNSVTASGHIPTKVDFWMLTSDQWDEWEKVPDCGGLFLVKSILQRAGSNALSTYEFTRDMPSSGVYYFVFLDKAEEASITLVIDGGVGQSTVTVTSYHTLYSTHETQFPTQTEVTSSRPAGFGALLFSGIGLIAVAVVAFAISRRKGTAPSLAHVPPAGPFARTQVVSPTPSALTVGKFCTNCGAALPAHASFCNKCGTKQ